MAYEKLAGTTLGESSAAVRGRVEAARAIQRERFAGLPILTNSEMRPAEIRQFCVLDSAGQALIKAAMRQLNLSARGYHRVLKLARTIADLAGATGSRPSTWPRPCSTGRARAYKPRSAHRAPKIW